MKSFFLSFLSCRLNPETGIEKKREEARDLRSISPFIILRGEESSPGEFRAKRKMPPFKIRSSNPIRRTRKALLLR